MLSDLDGSGLGGVPHAFVASTWMLYCASFSFRLLYSRCEELGAPASCTAKVSILCLLVELRMGEQEEYASRGCHAAAESTKGGLACMARRLQQPMTTPRVP